MILQHQKGRQGSLLILLLSTSYVILKYWGMLCSLGSMKVMDPYRDGIKTYLNAVWHAQFSPSATLFTGMNYPYPEHVVAASEMPGVAILLQLLEHIFPGISWHVFGIMHGLLLISIVACSWVLYKVFKIWQVADWVAIPAALFITILAPQNLRMPTHMGLAPLFVIPGLIYLMLSYIRKPGWRLSIGIGGFIILASLFHFYFFAITIITLFLFFLFWSLSNEFLTEQPQISRGRFMGHIALMFGLPMLLFIPWLILNDPVPERNPEPWGFLYYHASLDSVFASPHLPFWKWLSAIGVKFQESDFEGWSYIGITAGLFAIFYSLQWLASWFSRQINGNVAGTFGNETQALWFAGLVTLLLSFSWPFTMQGWEGLLDYFGPLKQFRSTGRFAWIFYFTANLMAITAIFHWAAGLKNQKRAMALTSLCIVMLGLEAYQFSESGAYYHNDKLREIAELKKGQRFSDAAVNWSHYQAIVPLPYFNVGSDHFFSIGGAESVQKSLILSTQSGLPVTGAMLTRSAPWQAFLQHQLVTEPYRIPAIFEDYPDQRPLLLLFSNVLGPADIGKWDHLKKYSKPILGGASWTLYETELSDFQKRIQFRVDSLKTLVKQFSGPEKGAFKTSSDSVVFFLNGLDNVPSEKVYRGKGAMPISGSDYHKICVDSLPDSKAGEDYLLSFWVFCKEVGQATSTIFLKEYDNEGNLLQQRTYGIGFQARVFDPNGWVLLECPFLPAGNSSLFEVGLQWPKAKNNQKIWVDEVLIKPSNAHLARETTSEFWYDNRHWNFSNGTLDLLN